MTAATAPAPPRSGPRLPAQAARLVRALALEVVALGPDAWRVTGGAGEHVVDVAGCDCADARIRGPGCKHGLAVLLIRCAPELRLAVAALAGAVHGGPAP
jgi:hypothetical protein